MNALQTNVSLRNFNTLRLCSIAAWFVAARSVDEVQECVHEARNRGGFAHHYGGRSDAT